MYHLVISYIGENARMLKSLKIAKETIKSFIERKFIEEASRMSAKDIETWGKIELLLRLKTFHHNEELKKKLIERIVNMDIPNWIKIWFIEQAGISQGEDENFRFMRMVLYGVCSKELEVFEETPQRRWGLSPIEAFFLKLYMLLDAAKELQQSEIEDTLEKIKEEVLKRGDFIEKECEELRRIELTLSSLLEKEDEKDKNSS